MCWDSQIYIGVSVKHIDIGWSVKPSDKCFVALRCREQFWGRPNIFHGVIYATFTFFPIAPFQEPTIFFRGKSDLRLRQRSRFWCCPPSDWCEISGMWGAAVVRNTAVCICAKFHFHFCQSAFTFIYFISTLQCLCFLWEHFSSFSWDCFQSRWILSVCYHL